MTPQISDPIYSLEDIQGLWSRGSVDDVPINHLSVCNNCNFSGKDITPRDGLSAVISLDNGIHGPLRRAIAFFVYSSDVKAVSQTSTIYPVLYLSQSGFLMDASTSPNTVVKDFSGYTPIPNGFVAIEAFSRVYISPLFNNEPITDFVYYWDGTNFFKLAGVAPGAGPTLAQANPGIVNAGVHGVAVSFQYADGFLSPPSPITNITSTGVNDIELTAIPTGGANVVARVLLMTLSNQLELFFVPGGTIAGNVTTTGTINVYDTSLIESADYLNDVMTSVPACNAIKFYNGRMVYIGRYDFPFLVMISDELLFDSISSVGGIINIPRGSAHTNSPSSALVINTILYILKPFGTYQTQDNGGDPNTWGVTIIDSALGSYDNGVTTFSSGLSGQDTLDISFIAHPRGLLLFNGSYSDPPLSYKIDTLWKNATQVGFNLIRTANDIVNKRLWIIVSTTQMLMMDYSNGMTPQAVRWSIWGFPNTIWPGSTVGGYAVDIQVVLDQTGAYYPLLVFTNTSGVGLPALYSLIPNQPYDLVSTTSISQSISTSTINTKKGAVTTFNGIRFRISGTSRFNIGLYDESQTLISSPDGFNLNYYTNNQDIFRGINFVNEKLIIGITGDNTTVGSFSLTRLDVFGNEVYKVRTYPKAIIHGTSQYIGGVIKISATAHGFTTGQKVNVLGVNGTIEANGNNQQITVVDADNFSINGSVWVNPWTSGGIAWLP
jgi:hypothetical protein